MNPNTDDAPVRPLSTPEPPENPAAGAPNDNPASNAAYIQPNQSGGSTSLPAQNGIALPYPGSSASVPKSLSNQQRIPIPGAQSKDEDTSIEREVIAKAMAVVQHTGHDPYLQAKEIAKVKADLLKRRYGKIIKVSEG
ncbi:MAG TPA: hypothetical protein VLG47_00025 [Candidatus Saccharimonadales bacterium]|nr:hypothetical protein [Candidatus Saccharimonadales bacterium]